MKNFYKKSLKIFHKFNAIHEQGKFLKENKFTLSINRIYDLHNNELSLENEKIQNLPLKECMVFNQHISVNTYENILVFPNFIARKYITYKTKNSSFEVILLPIGSFVHKIVAEDYEKLLNLLEKNRNISDMNTLKGYWELDKNEMETIPIHFHIDVPSYIGETKVSKQLWDDIMGRKYDTDTSPKDRQMNATYKRYLSRYTYQTKEINKLVCGKKRKLLSKKFDGKTINEMLRECAFLRKSFKDRDSQFKKDFKNNIPIVDVNFLDCITFCNKLSIECGLIPYYEDIVVHQERKIKFKSNPQSNGFRLPFALEWLYALAKGFDAYKNKSLLEIGAFEIDPNVEFVPMNFKQLKYSAENEKMGNGLCDLNILQGKNYLTAREIRYLKLGQPNSLGIYDMISQLGEQLGEIECFDTLEEAISEEFYQESMLRKLLRNLKKNKTLDVFMSDYIHQIDKTMIESFEKAKLHEDSKDIFDYASFCQFFWLDLTDIHFIIKNKESTIIDSKDYQMQGFDDSNLLKSNVSQFELGLPFSSLINEASSYVGECIGLRIVKNIPR